MILALDPGGHIGAARRNDDNTIDTCCIETAHFKWLAENVSKAELVIIEQFQATTINHYGLFTVELVGATMGIAAEYGIKVIRHTPQDRYPMKQRAIDHLRGTKKKHVIHEVDALAHLFVWEMLHK